MAPDMLGYNDLAVMGDKATQECDLSTVAVPNGMGLASSGVPTLPERVGGCNALNSRPVEGGSHRRR